MEAMAQAVGSAFDAITASTTLPAINPKPNWGWRWTLTGCESPDERAKSEEMLHEARSFVADMARGAEPRWLVLIGPSGCGKTYLAERITEWVKEFGRGLYLRERQRAGRDDAGSLWTYAQEGPMFRRWQILLNRLRQGDYARLEADCTDWFKVIDDLGTGATGADGEATAFAVQKMGELLDRRLRKWTVITTNFTRRQIAEQFDPRIASRLMRGGNVICDCEGLDDWGLRLERAKKASISEMRQRMAGVEVAA
jgi:energy-coupling factor transporter ATP-binding protein EcfA2